MTSGPAQESGQESGQDLERERRLLVEALAAAFGAATPEQPDAESAAAGPTPPHAPRAPHAHRADPATGAAYAAPDARPHGRPQDGQPQGEQAHDGQPQDGWSGDPHESEAAVGCACCGCRAPRWCAACPVCRGGAAALDPQLLERVADVATLLADGLRAAARRLSTPPTSDADERPTPDEHTPDQQEPERPPGDDEGNGR